MGPRVVKILGDVPEPPVLAEIVEHLRTGGLVAT